MPSRRCLALGSGGIIAITGYSDSDPNSTVVSDTATMKYVTIETPETPTLVLTPQGTLIHFNGEPGQGYRIQRAVNPSGPWVTIASVTAPPSGFIEHLDSTPLAYAFYRTAVP